LIAVSRYVSGLSGADNYCTDVSILSSGVLSVSSDLHCCCELGTGWFETEHLATLKSLLQPLTKRYLFSKLHKCVRIYQPCRQVLMSHTLF